MSQSPATFIKSWTGMADGMELIQSGELKIEVMENMATFGALFPFPVALDKVIPLMCGEAPPV